MTTTISRRAALRSIGTLAAAGAATAAFGLAWASEAAAVPASVPVARAARYYSIDAELAKLPPDVALTLRRELIAIIYDRCKRLGMTRARIDRMADNAGIMREDRP